MTSPKEKRARDLEMGEHVRIIGDLDDEFGQIIGLRQRGDDVLLTVSYPPEITIFPVDLPVLDGDEVVEVLA